MENSIKSTFGLRHEADVMSNKSAALVAALRPDNFPTIAQLRIYRDILNIEELGRKAGFKKNALRRKITNGTELSITESRAVGAVLSAAGIVLEKK